MFLKNIEQVIHMELPKRKPNRLTEYDCSTPNAFESEEGQKEFTEWKEQQKKSIADYQTGQG